MNGITAKDALTRLDKLLQIAEFLGQRMAETAEDLTPGNVAHHRAWFMMYGRQLKEMVDGYHDSGANDKIIATMFNADKKA